MPQNGRAQLRCARRHHLPFGTASTGAEQSATIGRYIRYKGYDIKLPVVDPENSAFYESNTRNDRHYECDASSRIEGIGRPKAEYSFQPDVVDEIMQVPDAASVSTALWLEKIIRRKAGASTGTNLWGALSVAERMMRHNHVDSTVTLLCGCGERYLDTYYNSDWVLDNIGDVRPYLDQLNSWLAT